MMNLSKYVFVKLYIRKR